MLTFLILAPLLVAPPLAPSPQADGCEGERRPGAVRLTVIASNVRSGSGDVVFSVYPDDSARFLKSRAYVGRVRTRAQAPATRACFWVMPASYAAVTYHDENGDKKFNRVLFSPREGFGVSNDAPTTFGLPKFSAVRFAVPASGRTLTIRTRYAR